MDKIVWKKTTYGGSKYADLGHGIRLLAEYPLTGERHEGYVIGIGIGGFETQEECIRMCESIAIDIIKDLHKRFAV